MFVLEIRDRHYWLYGTLGMLLILLYTKFYLCPKFIKHLLEPDFAKKSKYNKDKDFLLCCKLFLLLTCIAVTLFSLLGETHSNSLVLQFQQRHHGRTVLSCATFVWFIYSLYVS